MYEKKGAENEIVYDVWVLRSWKYVIFVFFFFNDTATTEIYTLSLHDALPIWRWQRRWTDDRRAFQLAGRHRGGSEWLYRRC